MRLCEVLGARSRPLNLHRSTMRLYACTIVAFGTAVVARSVPWLECEGPGTGSGNTCFLGDLVRLLFLGLSRVAFPHLHLSTHVLANAGGHGALGLGDDRDYSSPTAVVGEHLLRFPSTLLHNRQSLGQFHSPILVIDWSSHNIRRTGCGHMQSCSSARRAVALRVRFAGLFWIWRLCTPPAAVQRLPLPTRVFCSGDL